MEKYLATTEEVKTSPETDPIKYQVETVNAERRKLTPWEKGFVESITPQVKRSGGGVLSLLQKDILAKIYAGMYDSIRRKNA